jgi:hypothetical protein
MAVPGDVTCRAVGIAACASGFVADGKGGCDVTLPTAACPPGKMAVPGETACRDVAPCGTGNWGDLPTDSTPTIYVDAGYSGGSSDGTQAHPFVTIGAAIDAASVTSPTRIAIAAGSYVENLFVKKPVQLWGRCPAMVELRGKDDDALSPVIALLHGFTEVRKLAVRGATKGGGDGIAMEANALVQETWVHDLAGYGIGALGNSSLSVTVRGSLVERSTGAGIEVFGCNALLDSTVIRDTVPSSGKGYGLYVGNSGKSIGTVTMHSGLLERNATAGVMAIGGNTTIEATVVRDTKTAPGANIGRGIQASRDDATKTDGVLVVRDSLVANNIDLGIFGMGSSVTVESTVVRHTQPHPTTGKDDPAGEGIAVAPSADEPSTLLVQRSVVEGNTSAGIGAKGSTAKIEGTIVRDTKSRPAGDQGAGILVAADATTLIASALTLTGSLVENNVTTGVAVFGSTASIASTVVRLTAQGAPGTGAYGIAVVVDRSSGAGGDLTLTGSLVEKNSQYGIGVIGSKANIDSTVVRDGQPGGPLSAAGDGITVQDDSGSVLRGTLYVRRCVIERNSETGIYVLGSDATVEHTVVRATLARPDDGTVGDGIGIESHAANVASLALSSSLLTANARAGVSVFGGQLSLERTLVTCDAFEIDIESWPKGEGGRGPSIEDLGGNLCGCGAKKGECRANSAGLEPAPAPTP